MNSNDYVSVWFSGQDAIAFAVNVVGPSLVAVGVLRLLCLGVSKPRSL